MMGAITAAVLQKAFAVNGLVSGTNHLYQVELIIEKDNYWKGVFLESSAAFILVFMQISSHNKATKFSDDLITNTAFLSAATLIAMMIGGYEMEILLLTPVNPTVGFAIFFSRQTKDQWKCMWLYTIVPWLGAFLALGFYVCVYFKARI